MLKAIKLPREAPVHRSKSTGSLDRFDLERGLKQGSAIAALLFNIYMGAAIEQRTKSSTKIRH
jgi:hypothetical protein